MMLSQAYETLKEWMKRHHAGRKLLILLVVGTILSVIATYIMLTKASPFLKSRGFLVFFLSLDFVFFMTLAAVVAKYVAALWAERKSDQAGSKLHSRIVAIFSLLAIAPTILVAGFSAIFFNIVIQSWFNQRVETAIGESLAVAGAYLGEHQKVISANAQAMAAELVPLYLSSDSEALAQKLTDQTQLRTLDEAIVFNDKMQVLGRSRFSFSLDFEAIPVSDLEAAKTAPVIHTNEENDRVRALVAINPSTNTYLLVGRRVSPTVLTRIDNASKAVQEYARLESHGASIALKFAGIFVGIAILLLLAAVLGGLLFANKLARPIRRLIEASDEVCRGNLSVRIAEAEETEELSSLTSAFNRMTAQLESQRDALIVAQRNAAWAEIARRIAHEIKNPLTPIQLSAERLKRRYTKQISHDPETFQNCVDTIIRQVEHIGQLVGEFSSFARMRAPILKPEDLVQICKEEIFLQQHSHPELKIDFSSSLNTLSFACDRGQIGQVLTNLIQNARESIEAKKPLEGHVDISLKTEAQKIILQISDNGGGLPPEGRERLTEPYVTFRDKGTGLGLAIVKKIVEDHGGILSFQDRPGGGAIVQISFTVMR